MMNWFATLFGRVTTAVCMMLVAAACEDSRVTGPAPSGTGLTRFFVTDAPFPFDALDAAGVTIDKVEVHVTAGESSGFIEVPLVDEMGNPMDSQTLDLLDLQNGVMALLASAELPEGSLTQIRLFVVEAFLVLNDATTYSVSVPSGEQTGIKVNPVPPITVTANGADILLDIDVSRSFVLHGNPETPAGIQGFSFTPAIRAINLAEVGVVAGTVTSSADGSPISGATVTAALGGDEADTASDENGKYLLLLTPGTYDVTAEAEGFVSDTQMATVTPGDTTTVDFALDPTS